MRIAAGVVWLFVGRTRGCVGILLSNFGRRGPDKELDYLNEASNQRKCKEALEPRLKERIYIPEVFDQHTTRKVLVSEWIEGKQLAKSPATVINKLIPVGVECFLIQLLETGFFHADPHPGNLLVTPDGKLALIDFGLMADVPLQDTKTMTKTIVHLMQGDVPGLVQDAVELGFLPEDVDKVKNLIVKQKSKSKSKSTPLHHH